ncbi:MAG: hypothetical protein MZU95_00220 [Desulfomicrobium escambiense]|nr:hypothetical protein [Desulfomicrobium escambiense]
MVPLIERLADGRHHADHDRAPAAGALPGGQPGPGGAQLRREARRGQRRGGHGRPARPGSLLRVRGGRGGDGPCLRPAA